MQDIHRTCHLGSYFPYQNFPHPAILPDIKQVPPRQAELASRLEKLCELSLESL